MLAGDGERDQAAWALREHYVRGRLTVDELSSRVERVLTARSRRELRSAFRGLPRALEGGGLAAEGRSLAQAALRAAALVLATAAYALFSFVLFVVFVLTMLIHGVSTGTLVAFLVVWLVPTYVLSRLWHRRPPRGISPG
jgi:Flp pilus assembly protein TadB